MSPPNVSRDFLTAEWGKVKLHAIVPSERYTPGRRFRTDLQTHVSATKMDPPTLADSCSSTSRSPSHMVTGNIFEKEVGKGVAKPQGMWLGYPDDKAQGLSLSFILPWNSGCWVPTPRLLEFDFPKPGHSPTCPAEQLLILWISLDDTSGKTFLSLRYPVCSFFCAPKSLPTGWQRHCVSPSCLGPCTCVPGSRGRVLSLSVPSTGKEPSTC